MEEAAAYQQLLDEFEVTHDELASRIGRSRPVISNMIRLLRLPIAVQRRVAAGVLSAGHARALLALEAGPEAQEELAARIVAEGPVGAGDRGGGDAGQPRQPRPATQAAAQAHPDAGSAGGRRTAVGTYDTKVTVSLGKRKGKIVVEFGSVDDLQRIVGSWTPLRAETPGTATPASYVTVTQSVAGVRRRPTRTGNCSVQQGFSTTRPAGGRLPAGTGPQVGASPILEGLLCLFAPRESRGD